MGCLKSKDDNNLSHYILSNDENDEPKNESQHNEDTNIIFQNEQDILIREKQLIQTIISKNNINLTNTLIKDVFNKLNNKSLAEKIFYINTFNKTFEELRNVPARTGVGWSYKDDYQTDLKNAFQQIFDIDITNYGITSRYYRSDVLLNDKIINEPHKDVDTYTHYKTHYTIIQYENNTFTLSWDTGPILYYTKNFLSNELRLKLYNNLSILIENCNDCIYPNAERKNAKPQERIFDIWDMMYGSFDGEQLQNDNSKQDNIDHDEDTGIEYDHNDICIKHIIDPLLNNFGHKYWIPSILSIDENNNCKFVTEIPNLPRLHYEHVYPVFEKILSAIIPKFEWILGCDLKMKCIQIITDIQHYIVKSNTYYNGNWHREGFKNGEFIQCGAIYYFNKTENFFETDVFEIKSKGHRTCAGDFLAKYNINIDENNLIIFDNESSIHRLNTLTSVKRDNDEKDVGYRSHILFLIPKYKINSMRDFNVNTHYMYPDVLNYWIREHGIEYFPMPLKKVILKNMNVCDSGWSDIIKQRNDARKLRMNVGKWMNIDLGATN
eukprot:464703_1